MTHKLFINRQFILFLLVGGFAAVVNFSSRLLFSEFLSFRWSVVFAYLIGMLTAYILSRYLVFDKSGRHAYAELYRFALVNLVAVAQVWIISVGLMEYVFPVLLFDFYPEEMAHSIGLIIPVLTSFVGHKYFTFTRSNNESPLSSDKASK